MPSEEVRKTLYSIADVLMTGIQDGKHVVEDGGAIYSQKRSNDGDKRHVLPEEQREVWVEFLQNRGDRRWNRQ